VVERAATALLEALRAGKACLHPTDTLPGLAFDPESAAGRAAVVAVKGRDATAPFLGLVPDVASACRNWAPLPGGWERVLARLWPGPLSVIWRASAAAPRALIGADALGSSIGLRVPKLGAGAAWFEALLRQAPWPLPTTSVNEHGQPPFADWGAAAEFLAGRPACYVPELEGAAPPVFAQALPSTIIKLDEDGGFQVVRLGAMPVAVIEKARAAEGAELHG
jgi:L-threonylcarbamoyladenylate synthase